MSEARSEHMPPSDLYERVRKSIIRRGGVYDPNIDRYAGSLAQAVLADLGLRPVARVREMALETGAEWIDGNGQKIEHVENPHCLDDGALLFVAAEFGSSGGSDV